MGVTRTMRHTPLGKKASESEVSRLQQHATSALSVQAARRMLHSAKRVQGAHVALSLGPRAAPALLQRFEGKA